MMFGGVPGNRSEEPITCRISSGGFSIGPCSSNACSTVFPTCWAGCSEAFSELSMSKVDLGLERSSSSMLTSSSLRC